MNASLLPIYHSKANLTNLFADYSNVYLLPLICFIGILTSIACILGSYKRDESNSTALCYIFINSVNDLLFLLIEFFVVVIRCGTLCPLGYTYFSKFYEIYLFLYVGYVLANSQVFFNIYISYDRLKMFSAKCEPLTQRKLYYVYGVCTAIALIANLPPYAIAKEVVALGIYIPDPNSTSFEVLYIRSIRDTFQSVAWQNVLTAIVTIKDPFMFIVYCSINMLVCVRFNQFLNKRKSLVSNRTNTSNDVSSTVVTPSSKSNRRSISRDKKESSYTLLTIVSCVVYLVGNFIDCFSIIAAIFSFDIYNKYGFINISGNALFYASHSVHLFMYYEFNTAFKKQFNSSFRFKC